MARASIRTVCSSRSQESGEREEEGASVHICKEVVDIRKSANSHWVVVFCVVRISAELHSMKKFGKCSDKKIALECERGLHIYSKYLRVGGFNKKSIGFISSPKY